MEILLGVWFWLAILVVSGLIILGIEEDSGPGTTSAAVIGSGVIWFLSGAHNPLPYLASHWLEVVASVVVYVIGGAVWSVAKWWFFLHNKADEYESKRDRYKTEFDALNEQQKTYYTDYKGYVQHQGFPPAVGDHKGDMMMWMVWWPFSGIWTILNEPLKRAFRFIYQELLSTYTKIANSVFTGRFTELK